MYYTLPMAMGKRKRNRQPSMWVAAIDFPTAASYPVLYTIESTAAGAEVR